MKIFKILKSKNKVKWHILDVDGIHSACSTTVLTPKAWSITSERELKEFDGETLCNSCVGRMYAKGLITIKEVK